MAGSDIPCYRGISIQVDMARAYSVPSGPYSVLRLNALRPSQRSSWPTTGDNVTRVGQRAGEPVQFGEHQGVAGAARRQRLT
jgi:hypothetical protein